MSFVNDLKKLAYCGLLAGAVVGLVGYCTENAPRTMTNKNARATALLVLMAASQNKDSNGGVIEIGETRHINKANKLENKIQEERLAEDSGMSDNELYDPELSYEMGADRQNPRYASFRYQDELADILKHSARVGVEPELLMAIRSAENGADGVAYGIIPQGNAKERYDSDKGYSVDGEFHEYASEREKQMCWAAWTLKKNADRGVTSIEKLAEIYCPVRADNDADGVNANWAGNVQRFYEKFKGE